MQNVEYANAYSEVLEILRYVSIDDFNKIPKEQIDFLKIYRVKFQVKNRL